MKPHHDYVRLWVASLETQNFSFSAYGMTEDEALFALKQGLVTHGDQCNLEPDWGDIYDDAIYVREATLGHAYREGSHQPIYAP